MRDMPDPMCCELAQESESPQKNPYHPIRLQKDLLPGPAPHPSAGTQTDLTGTQRQG